MKEENKKLKLNGLRDFSSSGAHASDEEIIAYQFDMIGSQEEKQRLQDHFAVCRRCTQAVLELNELTESAAVSGALPGEEVWQQFKSKLIAEKLPAGDTKANENAKPIWRGFFDYFSLKFAGAAGAFLALLIIVGLIITAVRNFSLSEPTVAQIERISNENTMPFPVNTRTNNQQSLPPEQETNISTDRPANRNSNSISNSKTRIIPANVITSPKPVNSPINPSSSPVRIELYPDESVRSIDAADLRKVKFPRNTKEILLKLAAPPSKSMSKFTVEITNAQKSTILTQTVRPSKADSFQVKVSSAQLSPGFYLVNLYQQSEGERKLFKSYSFIVEFE